MAVLDSYTYICSIFEYTLYIDPILHPYEKVGGRQGYKYLKSQGAADQNTSAMAVLAYNCECQLSTVGIRIIGTPYTFNTINYRHLELCHHSACNPRVRKLYKKY